MSEFPSNYRSLHDFLDWLESHEQLIRIKQPISVELEMTEIHRRVLATKGPALLFEKPVLADGQISDIPVITNLFGTVERVARGMGCRPSHLRELGQRLAFLKQPTPPRGFRDTLEKLPVLKDVMAMKPSISKKAKVQKQVFQGDKIDLSLLPIQTCWPGEPAPLITWPLVTTRPPDSENTSDYNIGVYRMQVLSKNSTLMRWLAHRGGALHHRLWQAKGRDMPVAVAIGADPGTILAAVTPVPDTLSEYHYAGLLRGEKLTLTPAKTVPLLVPAEAEIILEGYVSVSKTAPEGPYGDHTGYYNSVEHFPVFELTAITMRDHPVYLSTFTGRPPDEPSVIGEALNDVFVPLLQQQFPEIIDFWLPPEGCSYRVGICAIKKKYPGHARRIMMGIWSFLAQFSYTKLLIIVDEDINPRSWEDVMWAVSTRMDASRDLMVVDNTPIDYLDFASPVSGLGGKLGLDATNKMDGETSREWGEVLSMNEDVIKRIDEIWADLGLSDFISGGQI
ncbi:MAG: UbiD family decarboxylase [bacterium]|nr:UbiD family decarboxylase [bacterium]